jgi:glycosyltransferase involved in cell wall biosynthesis
MRVLMISKACIVGIYQRKLEGIARRGVDLLVLVPPSWNDERGEIQLERAYTAGYRLEPIPITFNGNFHLHFYWNIGKWMRDFKPQIVHIDEEPYNLASWQALYYAKRIGAKSLFFSWQNILRDYPIPFKWGEKWVLNNVDHAIVGTESAAQVWRAKGFKRDIDVIAQFGVDTGLFYPAKHRANRPFTIGCVARLVPEKGVDMLIRAFAQLDGDPRLRIIGGGPEKAALESLAESLGVADRVTFLDQIASGEMPAQYRLIDALAVPSLTRPNWKEQFGPRATIEALASGVPVVGSNSGAIPDVLDGAGLIVPEGDVDSLADGLRQLQAEPALRESLAVKGRDRIVERYTHDQVAEATVRVYQHIIESSQR